MSASSKSWMMPAPFMATAVTRPCSIQLTRIGVRPTLMTCAPMPTITGRPLAMGLRNSVGHGAERFDGENVGKGSIEPTEAASAAPGLGKIRDAHFAVPLLERIGL